MKQQEVFTRIGGIIKELNDQFKYLEDDPAKINELELELFVANAHFLANHAEVLKKLSLQEPAAVTAKAEPAITEQPPATQSPKEERYFEPLVHEVAEDNPAAQIDLSEGAPSDDYSYTRQEPEIIKHELEIDESWADDEDEEEEPEIVPEPEREPIAKVSEKPVEIVPPVSIEKPVVQSQKTTEPDEVLTINERMSAQFNHTHEHALPPVTDLKQAITLNDKLLFVRDLFNGYSLAYSEAIDILNRFKSFEEADTYLKKNYAVKNNWDTKPETSEKLYRLLRRRFI